MNKIILRHWAYREGMSADLHYHGPNPYEGASDREAEREWFKGRRARLERALLAATPRPLSELLTAAEQVGIPGRA